MRTALFVLVALTALGAALVPGARLNGKSGVEADSDIPVASAGFLNQVGDVDCNDEVSSIDAALVLQFQARLAHFLPCHQAADVYEDGEIDARDAALILQIEAGLCCLWIWP